MAQESTAYTADSIRVLEGLGAVRKRPGMYVGSTDERGLHRLVFTAADWAMDEVLAGRATRVEVALGADGGVRVAHDGVTPDLDARLTTLTAGRPHGLGYVPLQSFGSDLAVVNALSRRLVTETGGAMTAITFWPDPDTFKTTQCSFDVVAEYCKDMALLNHGLDVTLADDRRSNRFHFPDGVRALVGFLDEREPSSAPLHPDVISFEQSDPAAFGASGAMEIAWRWRDSGPEQVRSFANSQLTRDGGVHQNGFRAGVADAVNAYAREQGLAASAAPGLSVDRICESLTAVVSVKVESPFYSGCTRGALGNDDVFPAVRRAVADHLGGWLGNHPRSAAAVLGRVMSATAAEPDSLRPG